MKNAILGFLAVLALAGSLLCTSSARAAKISGYLTVYNNSNVAITIYVDGTEKGSIEPGRRSSWLIGDSKERSSYTLSADGPGVGKQTVVNGNYSDYTWNVP